MADSEHAAHPPNDEMAEYGANDDQKLDIAAEQLFTAPEESENPKNFIVRFFSYILAFAIPGLGMFCEGYFVFAIGNLKPIWVAAYPECFETNAECSKSLTESINYTAVVGIIFGLLVFVFWICSLNKKIRSLIPAVLMLVFGALMTASSGSSASKLFTMFTAVQFFFGAGVGVEYPVAAAAACERAESSRRLSGRRGEISASVLSMQSWGNFANTAILAILMVAYNQRKYPFNESDLETVWRISLGLGLVAVVIMVIWRIFVVRDTPVLNAKHKAVAMLGNDEDMEGKIYIFAEHYWHRLLGGALSWFLWDAIYYGNKIFQGAFIKIIDPQADMVGILWWSTLNSFVALVGNYAAAFTVDKPWMGRAHMQTTGFLWVGFLFLMCSMFYKDLSGKTLINAFKFLYFFASFWGQFTNTTSWLIPAEIAPTEMRYFCHSISAISGKAGAVMAVVVFTSCSNETKFTILAACGLAGALISYLFIPDLSGLDLRETDKRWLSIVSEKPESYTGKASDPQFLSNWECMTSGGKRNNPTAPSAGKLD